MDEKPIKLSPTSLNLFLECQLCFWLEKKKGIRRPPPYPYALNAAVDLLLKQEFDAFREKGELHPLLASHHIEAKLFSDQARLQKWRNNFQGIRYYDQDLRATLFGAVDDILEFPDGSLAPLDYKSTGAKEATIYDRFQYQMDAYTFLLEKKGFKTKKKGYLAFYIVNKEDGFKDRLPFTRDLREIDTFPARTEQIFREAVALLRQEELPDHSADCKFGQWFHNIKRISS